MAGFLGMGNFSKVGKGVKKGQPRKRRFFLFFDLFKRKFGKLIKLNLLFLICCIPIITIGPAIAALTKITKNYVEEKPVFLVSDFFDAFKENFKQGFIIGVLSLALGICSYVAFLYYYILAYNTNKLFWIPTILIAIIVVLFITMNFYTYLLLVSLDLKIFQILRNSLMLTFLGARSNFFTIIFTTFIFLIGITPYTVLIFLLITFSSISLVVSFNSYQHVYKYLIKPYYEQAGIDNPYEPKEHDAIFEDATL